MITLNKREIHFENNKLEGMNVFKIASFDFDYNNKILKHNDFLLKLTSKEASLLMLLYLNKDIALTREYMLEAIWGNDDYFLGRSMDVYISKLRKYLKFDENVTIETIHGFGFKLLINEYL